MYLFIAIFGIIITALVEAAVAKAAYCVDDFKKRGQRNCVLLLLKAEEVKSRNQAKTSHFSTSFRLILAI